MQPFKSTIRQMMALVALAAIATSVNPMASQSAKYRDKADYHEANLEKLDLIRKLGHYPYCSLQSPRSHMPLWYDSDIAPVHHRYVAYHSRLARVYRRAAIFPWVSVAPEPPEPQWSVGPDRGP